MLAQGREEAVAEAWWPDSGLGVVGPSGGRGRRDADCERSVFPEIILRFLLAWTGGNYVERELR